MLNMIKTNIIRHTVSSELNTNTNIYCCKQKYVLFSSKAKQKTKVVFCFFVMGQNDATQTVRDFQAVLCVLCSVIWSSIKGEHSAFLPWDAAEATSTICVCPSVGPHAICLNVRVQCFLCAKLLAVRSAIRVFISVVLGVGCMCICSISNVCLSAYMWFDILSILSMSCDKVTKCRSGFVKA